MGALRSTVKSELEQGPRSLVRLRQLRELGPISTPSSFPEPFQRSSKSKQLYAFPNRDKPVASGRVLPWVAVAALPPHELQEHPNTEAEASHQGTRLV